MKILLGTFWVLNVQKVPLFWLLYGYNTGTLVVLEAVEKASKPCSDFGGYWKKRCGDFPQVGKSLLELADLLYNTDFDGLQVG